jgi:ferredoxin like protein
MNDKRLTIEDKLATVVFHVDKRAHIKVDKGLCAECKDRPCLTICPARNYDWDDSADQLIFNYEGCLECGSCKFLCNAVEWSYPRGGFGVSYDWG